MAECLEEGGSLMSIHSDYETKFAQSLSGHTNTWLGGAWWGGAQVEVHYFFRI
jgi:hypothetical protein